PALVHLDCVQRLGSGGADLLLGVGPPAQRTQRHRERRKRSGRARPRRRHLAEPSCSQPVHQRGGTARIRSTWWRLYFGEAAPISVGIPRRRSRRARSVQPALALRCPLPRRASCRRAAATTTANTAPEPPP